MMLRSIRYPLALVGMLLIVAPALAQAPLTADQIIQNLRSPPADAREAPAAAPSAAPPRGRSRGLSAPQSAPPATPGTVSPAAAVEPRIDNLFTEPRALSVRDRETVARVAEIRPRIELTIFFDFDSAELSPKAVPTLVELGKALTSDTLKGTRFLLAGHTDAKGSDDYNLRLSQRRADTIRRYLVSQFRVDEKRLLAIGYGEEQLKNTANPFADENRRVQVVNFGE